MRRVLLVFALVVVLGVCSCSQRNPDRNPVVRATELIPPEPATIATPTPTATASPSPTPTPTATPTATPTLYRLELTLQGSPEEDEFRLVFWYVPVEPGQPGLTLEEVRGKRLGGQVAQLCFVVGRASYSGPYYDSSTDPPAYRPDAYSMGSGHGEAPLPQECWELLRELATQYPRYAK